MYNVEERDDIDGSCVFYAYFRKERLTKSFDELHNAYNQFYALQPEDDYSACAMFARSALVSAQEETICSNGENVPRNLYKVFKGLLKPDTYRRMHESYQITSKYVHKEASKSGKLNINRCKEILRDIRRAIIDLEFLVLSEEERISHLNKAKALDVASDLDKLIGGELELSEEVLNEIRSSIKKLKKGEQIDEIQQTVILEGIKNAGGKVWEFTKPILREIATEALKKQYDL